MGLERLIGQFSDVLLRLTLSTSLAFAPACFHDKDDDEKDNNQPVATTPSNPQPPVVKTNVSGNVFYSGTTIPVSGVTVNIDNVVNTTGSAGSFSLQDIVVGSKPLKAEKTGYDLYQQTFNIAQGMQPIDIEMTSAQFTFSLTGTIKSSGNNQALQGATITLLNPNNTLSKLSSTSDAQGYYQIPTVPQGQRTVRFQLNNYTTQDIQIFIANTNNKYDLVMNPSGNVVLPSQITKNEVLKVYNSPYILDTDLTIKRGVKLTIEPGVEVRISPQKNITVEGSLEVLGTSSQPARLTTKNSNPQATDYWGSLIFNSDTLMQTTNLENLVIEYADKGMTFADLGQNSLQLPAITQLKIQYCNTGIIFTGQKIDKVSLNNISIEKTQRGVVITYDPSSNNQYEFSNLTINNSTTGITYEGNIKNMLNTGVPQDLSLTLNNTNITTNEVSGKGIIVPRLMLNNCTIQYRSTQQSDGIGVETVFLKGIGNNVIKGFKDGVEAMYNTTIGNQSFELSGIKIQECDAGLSEYVYGSLTNVIISNCGYGILSRRYFDKIDSCQITDCQLIGVFAGAGVSLLKNSVIDNCGDLGIFSGDEVKIVNSVISRNHVGLFIDDHWGSSTHLSSITVLNSRFSLNDYALVTTDIGGYFSLTTTCTNSIFYNNGTGIAGGYQGLWDKLIYDSSNNRHKMSSWSGSNWSHYSIEDFQRSLSIDYCTFYGAGMHLLNKTSASSYFNQYNQYNGLYNLILINNSIFYSTQQNSPPLYDPYNGTRSFIDYSGVVPSLGLVYSAISLPSSPFVDVTKGDLHILLTSPAKTASDTGREIGAYGNNGSPP